MKWVKIEKDYKVPIKSWCETIEDGALGQAINLAKHPVVYHHVSLMPDCHLGYGMPIGGVIACENAIIPNAVGVDIGRGGCRARNDLFDMPCCEVVRRDRHRIVCILMEIDGQDDLSSCWSA